MKTLIFNLIFSFFLVFPILSLADGLTGKYYDNNDFTNLIRTRVDSTIDFSWGSGSPDAAMGADDFSVIWEGYIYIPEESDYTFSIAHDDEFDLIIDGTTIYDSSSWTGGSDTFRDAGSYHLNEGYYSISIHFVEWGGGAYSRLAWRNTNSINSRTIVPTTNLFTAIPVANNPPTDISLSSESIDENEPTATDIGTFSTTDADAGDTHTYTFASGSGDSDNSSFTLTGNILQSNEVFDFEVKSSYSIRIKTDDGNSGSYEKNFTITINNLPDTVTQWINIDNDNWINLDVDPNFRLLYGGIGTSLFGDFTATGNSILSSNHPNNANLITDTTAYKLDDSSTQFSAHADPEKRNSSQATLNLPSYVQGNDIVWAGLFWQGHIYRHNNGDDETTADGVSAGWNSVTLKTPDGVNHNFTAPIGNNDNTHRSHHHASTDSNGLRYFYGAYHDVTDVVRNTYSPTNNTFVVGNIKTTEGKEDGAEYIYINNAQPAPLAFAGRFGLYGGWSLVVVYGVNATSAATNNVPLRNVSIYEGYDLFLTWGAGRVPFETTIPISGFITPKAGLLSSKMLFFGGAGDRGIEDDTLAIRDKFSSSFNDLSNTPNEIKKQFNHTYTNLGVHMTPGDENKQGMDLDIYDVSASMDHEQSETEVKFGVVKDNSHCDQVFPQVIGFSTQLYEPVFCYDYAYKQQERYFTEDNDGHTPPRLTGNVLTGADIETTIFIRNLVDSDVLVTDMKVSVTDINVSQAPYINSTTRVAKVGDLIPQSVSPSSTPTSISDIDIGTMHANDYFYIYYKQNPLTYTMDMPITLKANYNITIGGVTIPYTTQLGVNMEMCSTSNFEYTPIAGLFNTVHKDYYTWDGSTGTQYYNLPTQITSRAGNFKVISLDPDANDGFNTLKGQSTIVAVELIDAAAFHDTEASCLELESAISEKVWLQFENNVTNISFDRDTINTSLNNNFNTSTSNASDFYSTARENTAFRVSYIVTNDGNQSLIQTETTADGKTKILNFSEMVRDIGSCKIPVYYPTGASGNSSNTPTNNISVACGNAGNAGVSDAYIQSCMSCLFGYNTKAVCSRDNFSLRPEAFMIKINDQEQINPTSNLRLADHVSGVANPDGEILRIAAGYQYNIEINATNHINNSASPGYTKTYNSSNTDDTSKYFWQPRNSKNVSGCNDDSNKSNNVRFFNGLVDTNTSIDQIGHYTLKMRDNTWTTVDSNYLFMTHHTGSYFLNPITHPDCLQDVSTTREVDATAGSPIPLNGCIVSSQHDNNSTMKYRDYNVTSYPYQFDLNSTVLSVGLNADIFTTNAYIYMADMSKDENMSFHINGSVVARGEDNGTLSNFVNSCFAVPLDLNISKSDTNLTDSNGNNVIFQVLLNDLNSSGDVNQTMERNNTITTANILLQVPESYFFKNLEGSMNSRLNLNYLRRNNAAANPIVINYNDYNVSCTNEIADCEFNADLTNTKHTKGGIALNSNITHYYARNHSPRYRFTDNNGTAYIYYEVFCSGAGCNKSLLQNGTSSKTTDDPRWFINTQHTNGFGSANSVTQKNNTLVTGTDATGNHQDSSFILYNGTRGYPYKTTMETNSSNWLIYDKYDVNATKNSFEVEFINNNSSWAGMHETNSKTNTKASSRTNRRSMW